MSLLSVRLLYQDDATFLPIHRGEGGRDGAREEERTSGLQPPRLICLEMSDCLSALHPIEASSNVPANTGLISSPHKTSHGTRALRIQLRKSSSNARQGRAFQQHVPLIPKLAHAAQATHTPGPRQTQMAALFNGQSVAPHAKSEKPLQPRRG